MYSLLKLYHQQNPEVRKGMLWWNNSKENTRSKECPGIEWIKGKLCKQ